MLLFVGPPERSTARNTWPVSPTGLIDPPTRLPPILTVVIWSKVGVTAGFCALLDRIHQKLLPPLPAPIKRLPLLATSSVPYLGELGILIGFCQVTPSLVDRLIFPEPLQPKLDVQIWYWNP